jgi:hypothetical protein
MSDRTRLLLDKVTARHILTGLLTLAAGRDLTAEEVVALSLYEQAGPHGLWQFMVPSTEGVLRRLEERPRYAVIIQLFRQRVEVAFPTRYYKRWARRLQAHGFTSRRRGCVSPGDIWHRQRGAHLGPAYGGHVWPTDGELLRSTAYGYPGTFHGYAASAAHAVSSDKLA